jgi:pyrrolidone-carboxylate peptidase
MNKCLILLLFLSTELIASTVVVSGFDAFDNNLGNNSEVIGKILSKNFSNKNINIHFCGLRTVYFKSSEQLKDCINSLPIKPDYIIGLGEANCKGLKFETKAKNWMKDISQDNDGIHYEGEVIRPGETQSVAMTLDLKPIYSLLSRKDKRFITVSKDQGTFVCNNLSYIMASDITDIPYTFIHVPRYNCKGSDKLVKRSVDILTKTIQKLFN